MQVNAVEDELFHSFIAIEAAENWASDYAKTPEVHAKLLRSEARLEQKLRAFFKAQAKNTAKLIDWPQYRQEVQAAVNVRVLVKDDGVRDMANQFMKVVFEEIVTGITLGALAGEQRYKLNPGIGSSDAFIQDAAKERVATLVGKKLLKNGQIVNNPNVTYSVTDRIVEDIRSALATSISLGEKTEEASARIQQVIINPKRAETIARTESVNAFGKGLQVFGQKSGAIGKEWQDNGAVDVCKDNADAGVIPIDDLFPSGDSEPAAHPNCRCIMRLVYQNELDDNPDLFG
jgi:hypothetical protein